MKRIAKILFWALRFNQPGDIFVIAAMPAYCMWLGIWRGIFITLLIGGFVNWHCELRVEKLRRFHEQEFID